MCVGVENVFQVHIASVTCGFALLAMLMRWMSFIILLIVVPRCGRKMSFLLAVRSFHYLTVMQVKYTALLQHDWQLHCLSLLYQTNVALLFTSTNFNCIPALVTLGLCTDMQLLVVMCLFEPIKALGVIHTCKKVISCITCHFRARPWLL